MGKSGGKKSRALRDPDSRMQQLSELALGEIERRVLDHSATSQELTTLAKLGSQKALLENEKLRQENALLRAKTEAIESARKVEELYAEAVKMMGIYRGEAEETDEELF